MPAIWDMAVHRDNESRRKGKQKTDLLTSEHAGAVREPISGQGSQTHVYESQQCSRPHERLAQPTGWHVPKQGNSTQNRTCATVPQQYSCFLDAKNPPM
jgi:hypothetical protein